MNRLDGFVPFLLNQVIHHQAQGKRQFKIRHLAGDVMVVKLPPHPDGPIEVTRQITRMDGRKVDAFPFKLVTTVAQLRQDLRDGLATSNLSELLRG